MVIPLNSENADIISSALTYVSLKGKKKKDQSYTRTPDHAYYVIVRA